MQPMVHPGRAPIAGAAVAALVLGSIAATMSARVLLFGLGFRAPGDGLGVGIFLVLALATGGFAIGFGTSLLIRRRIEWVRGGALATLGALLGLVGAAGSIVVFLVLVVPRVAE